MSRIFITGSADGLGLAAARTLLAQGHDVVLHARSKERAAAFGELASDAARVVIGDLSSAEETRSIADQVNKIGRMDAVIHNAGIYMEKARGHPSKIVPVKIQQVERVEDADGFVDGRCSECLA